MHYLCRPYACMHVGLLCLLFSLYASRGVHPPEAMMHFPPCFRFSPYFQKIFRLWTIFKILNVTFSEKVFDFHPPEFLIFFSHRPKISNFLPIFPVSVYFPLFRENYYFPPTLTNFPPVFEKFTCFLHTLCVFRFLPTLLMMHLCITQCTYWTPLIVCKL